MGQQPALLAAPVGVELAIQHLLGPRAELPGRGGRSKEHVVRETARDWLWSREHPERVSLQPTSHDFDLFVVNAAADADFVRRYLLPALNVPLSRVLLLDELPLGAVLSPAYLADHWAVFGEQLASYVSVDDTHVIPLRLTECRLPCVSIAVSRSTSRIQIAGSSR